MAKDGYKIGRAWIEVVPSFDRTQVLVSEFVAKMRPLEIPAQIDPKHFAAEVKKAAEKAAKTTQVDLGQPKLDTSAVGKQISNVGKRLRKAGKDAKIEASVDVDTALFDARVAELAAKRISLSAKIDADIAALEAKITRLSEMEPDIRVELDTAAAEAKIEALQAEKRRVEIQIDADVTAAKAALLAVDRDLNALESQGRNVDINVEASSASRAIGIMGLLTAGIAAAGHAAPAAAAAIAAIPAALTVAGQGIGTMLAAFNGIGDAVKAMQASDDEAVSKASSNARTRTNAANSVASAQSALKGAQIAADRAAINGAEQVEQARENLARAEEALGNARESALRRTQDAERSLVSAQRAALEAQEALNRAREEAQERIEDLKLSLKGAALDEESAALALEKALAKLQALTDAGVTEGLEFREADIGARQAAQTLDEVRERLSDLRQEAEYAAKTGVAGDKAVIAAHKQTRDSAERIQAAERNLNEVRAEGARQIAQAQARVSESAEAVSRSQQQAAWANESAARAVADAQRNLGAASQRAGVEGSAAMDKLKLALSKLIPEGRAFAEFLQRDMKPALNDLSDAAQKAFLPKLTVAFRELLKLQPEVAAAVDLTGSAMGDLAVKGARMMTSGPWREDFGIVVRSNVKIMTSLGDAGLSIADSLRSIVVISGPTLQLFAALAHEGASWINQFVQGKRATGELSQFFTEMGERLQELFTWVFTVGKGIYDLVTTLAPLGAILLDVVEWVAELVSNFTEAYPLLTNIIGALGLAAAAFIFLGRSVTGITGAFKSGTDGIQRLVSAFRGAEERTQRIADSTSRFAGVADAALHPVNRLRSAVDSITAAYRDGAQATRAWMTAQTGSVSGGGALDGQLRAVDGTRSRLRDLQTGLVSMGSAAGGAANALRTGLTRAVSGLTDALGGPWSLAIAGAVAAIGLFTSKQQEASRATELQRKRVTDLASALRDSNGAIDASVRAKAAEALTNFELADGNRNLLEDARKLGVSLPQLTDAYLGNSDAQKDVVAQLRAIQKEHTAVDISSGELVETEDAVAFSARQLADIIDSQGGTFQGAVQNNKNLAAASADLGEKTRQLSEREREAQETTETLNLKLATIADTTKDVAQRGKEVIEFLDELKGKAPTVEDAADDINESIRRLAEGIKDSEGNVVNFRSGFVDAAGLIDTTTKAGSDLRGVVTGLAGDMAAAGTAAFEQARAAGKSMPEAYQAAVDSMDAYLVRIREALKANGLTEKQIDALLAQYNLVPPELATVIKLSGDMIAREQVAGVLGDLKGLPPETPVAVTALTGPAQEALLQLGYKIVELPDGTFQVFGNTQPGQQAADAFVAANQGRHITMEVAVRNAAAQKALDDFKAANKNLELKPFIGGSGTIHYNTPDGKVAILGTNLKYEALGEILQFFAKGGFSPMASNVAAVVPPNTMRVIGDRPHGDEAFIPINRSSRSIEILAETARRMGYVLAPMALGGVMGFASGAVTSTDVEAAGTVATSPEQLAALASGISTIADASVVLSVALALLKSDTIAYTTTALLPLVSYVNGAVVPTLDVLIARMTPVQTSFTTTAGVVATATQSMVGSTATAVTQIGTYLATLRTGLQQTGQSVENTSMWMRDSWARVREYVAAPSRQALVIMNDGLILAWNKLNVDFGLNKPIAPVPIKFRRGGAVGGIGDNDTVDAKLKPGEYVFSTEAIDAMGGLPTVDTLHRMAVSGIIGPDTRLGDVGDSRRRQDLMKDVAIDDLPLHYAYGGVQPHVAAAGDEIVRIFGGLPGGIGGVGSRPNASDHPVGLALDFMTMNNKSLGDKIAGHLVANAQRMMVKYLIWQQSFNAGDGWSPMEDRGSITANHYDHVHASFLRAGQLGRAFSGAGMVDSTAAITEAFAKTYSLIDQFAGRFPGSVMAEQAVGIVRQATDRIKQFALDKLNASSITGSPGRAANIEFARLALARFGWGPEQLAPLIALWDGESKWNHTARNPSSGAYGIPQSLPAEKMASAGPDWRTNPATQILWGLGYIKNRPDYGSPAAAYAKWQSRSPHWYDDGGWLPPGYSTVANHTGRPEAILTQDQWNSLSSMAGLTTGGGSRSVTVYARTDASPDHIAHVVDRRLAIGSRL